MKINFIVRLKNPVFWVTMTPVLVTLTYTVISMFGVVPGVSEDVVTNNILAVVSALAAIGVLVDPTTKGVGDSEQAMGYKEPKEV